MSASTTGSTRMTQAKASGIFYTPRPIVRYIVREAIQTLVGDGHSPRDLRVLDPSCGEGVFLEESLTYLALAAGCRNPLQGALPQIFGVDTDREAVRRARGKLARAAGLAGTGATCLTRNVGCGDALIGPAPGDPPRSPAAPREARSFDWQATFPEVFRAGGFDVIVGNPPYVNIRILSQTRGPGIREYLRRHYRCARGAYDLYVLFLERAYGLLRPGGVCGMIIPNKLATMDYARACRRLLVHHTTLLQVVDVSDLQIFSAASVYPYIIFWRKEAPCETHGLSMASAGSLTDLERRLVSVRVHQRRLDSEHGFDLHGALDVESRVPTQPLAERATLCSGTTGFVAQTLAREIIERDVAPSAPHFEFIVSGNIDRFEIRPGSVRFMKRRFRQPVLATESALLSNEKRRLYRSAKIVVAGMTRRLEAAWDRSGLALGVQVYAVTGFQDDPFFILGLLNSKLMSYLFQLRFRAKRLSRGYLALNKSQLAKLPIRLAEDPAARRQARHLANLVGRMLKLSRRDRAGGSGQRLDLQIDRLVYEMYLITDSEIEQVESTVAC